MLAENILVCTALDHLVH